MERVKILDCTLRDGGYVNNWDFGDANIDKIITSLISSGIEQIECGFLSDGFVFSKDRTLYKSLSEFKNKCNYNNFAFMVNFGECDFNKLDYPCDYELRIAFKPFHLNGLYKYIKPLADKKIRFSLNPMHISLYSEEELRILCDIVNETMPACLTAVDTMGIMTENDTERIFQYLDTRVSHKVKLGFHSHNNLGLSLRNTLTFMSVCANHKLVLDTSLGGLARGGGMLQTEVITNYLNGNFCSKYDLMALDKVVREVIIPIKVRYNSDENYPYYLSAKYRCHPNYAKYLYEKNYGYDMLENVLKSIPDGDKPYYNSEVLKQVILEKTAFCELTL